MSFFPAVNYPDGINSPAAFVAVADLTGNGIPDIVTTEPFQDYQLSVFLGKGDGTFQPAVTYLSGDGPVGVQIADLRGNGIRDIITSNNAGTVSVLLGNGDGTFQHKRDFATGAAFEADDLVVADLTGSGIPDIATANQNDGTVSVLLGNGDGTFKPPTIYPAGVRPIHIAAGRFGSESDLPNLVVTNVQSGTSTGAVNVLVNHGDGTFRSPVAYPVGSLPLGLALGDFANTGTLDIAVANFQSNSVSLLMGNGDHTFQPARTISVPGGPNSLVAADFNNDGNLDLAVTLQGGSDRVSVLLGDGTGNFARPLNFATDPDPQGIAAADLNNDGFADLVTANVIGRSATVLLNDGTWDMAPQGVKAAVATVQRVTPDQALALRALPLEVSEGGTPRVVSAGPGRLIDWSAPMWSDSTPAALPASATFSPTRPASALSAGANQDLEAAGLLQADPGLLDRLLRAEELSPGTAASLPE